MVRRRCNLQRHQACCGHSRYGNACGHEPDGCISTKLSLICFLLTLGLRALLENVLHRHFRAVAHHSPNRA
ncbi:Uncharacterised protein [Vibrio cholerae]|nr:Uncharacterised protein [Vibrio cholerae]